MVSVRIRALFNVGTADCEITLSDRQSYLSYLIVGEYDSTGRKTFGWVEKDGDLGDNTGPTSPEETVYVGQIVDAGVVINLNPCYRWYRHPSAFSTSPISPRRALFHRRQHRHDLSFFN